MFVKLALITSLAAAGVAGVAHPSQSAGPVRHYTVRPGDTLWSIAASRYGGDPREAVWRLRQQNPAVTAGLQPGDVLTLP
jgi:nucleoid-associated protein YgaU